MEATQISPKNIPAAVATLVHTVNSCTEDGEYTDTQEAAICTIMAALAKTFEVAPESVEYVYGANWAIEGVQVGTMKLTVAK